jgi:hypothetical protein
MIALSKGEIWIRAALLPNSALNAVRLSRQPLSPALGLSLLVVMPMGGPFYMKWLPYFHKSILASHVHSIGHSILIGTPRSHRQRPGNLHSIIR